VTAFQTEAGEGNMDIVRLLIDAGADINARAVGGGEGN
jgi:ankyrin repeat protein